jgi:hypothetical protein
VALANSLQLCEEEIACLKLSQSEIEGRHLTLKSLLGLLK